MTAQGFQESTAEALRQRVQQLERALCKMHGFDGFPEGRNAVDYVVRREAAQAAGFLTGEALRLATDQPSGG